VKAYLTVVGVGLIILAVVLFVRRLSALLRGASAVGTVQGHEARTMDEQVHYFPVVEFTDSTGNRHRFTSVAGGSDKTPVIGTTVRVRYMASDPKNAYIESFLHMWAGPLGCVALGVGALAMLWQH
jgi:hypothetical protein